MAIILSRLERDIQRIVDAVIQLIAGRGNYSGNCTLAANATSTVVKAPNCSPACEVFLFPNTANAATELGNGTIYIPQAAIIKGQFTIAHANNAQIDRTFSFITVGG